MHYDVFNGDADGIIALLQLRWVQPLQNKLITGVKRDISLLSRVPMGASSVTVLDISMEKNADALIELLSGKIPVMYCDHHRTGEIPEDENFEVIVDLSPDTCTSLLVNHHLSGKYELWAIAAAFGDNVRAVAAEMAKSLNLKDEQVAFLCELGTLINYNSYGASIDDLHISPVELFKELQSYPNPFSLLDDLSSPYYRLKEGYKADKKYVGQLEPFFDSEICTVYVLPDKIWARRMSGVFGNELANQYHHKAHAIVTCNPSGKSYTVSVRAPLLTRSGADEICCQFPTGGGRKAAAGINQLPLNQLDRFVEKLNEFYQ
ncbi:hypothetical protein C942_01625 [Photobacterium marinum]|uniref:DHHA1 domain-containing protein n=1 Tax=Photobacterium marinum TaxID=1056511 RepID=L8JBV8_9GAMM|nr:DHH family phosphoesterase [Photobacterium marinum]ELR65054.1 hypothetical protein C942_01625 [Photobacterium marinum]